MQNTLTHTSLRRNLAVHRIVSILFSACSNRDMMINVCPTFEFTKFPITYLPLTLYTTPFIQIIMAVKSSTVDHSYRRRPMWCTRRVETFPDLIQFMFRPFLRTLNNWITNMSNRRITKWSLPEIHVRTKPLDISFSHCTSRHNQTAIFYMKWHSSTYKLRPNVLAILLNCVHHITPAENMLRISNEFWDPIIQSCWLSWF